MQKTIGVKAGDRLDAMVSDIIEAALANDGAVIRFSPVIDQSVIELRDWLFTHVYQA